MAPGVRKAAILLWGAGAFVLAGPSIAQDEVPRPKVDERGVFHLPAFGIPPSSLASQEATQALIESSRAAQGLAPRPPWDRLYEHLESDDGIRRLRAAVDASQTAAANRMLEEIPVDVRRQTIGGVRAAVVTPKSGVAARNRHRVLINLHGGGMIWGGKGEDLLGSIPIAAKGGFKVVSVDYRLSPEHTYPAAVEDVESVYRALLRTHRPEDIGIYGCSAGAILSAQATAWFQQRGLPRPGAIGLLGGGGVYSDEGDSSFYAAAFLGPVIGEVPDHTRPEQSRPRRLKELYLRGTDQGGRAVWPARHQDVLSRFPPTLLINSSRDLTLSGAAFTHSRLVKAGAVADLHVWEGVNHCFVYSPRLPEAQEAYDVMIRFFDRHLGVEAPARPRP